MGNILKKIVDAYSFLVSPWLGSRCRFAPSCSEYAKQAIDQHGVAKAAVLTTKRLCRCHPWGGHGYDPVPPTTKSEPYFQYESVQHEADHSKINRLKQTQS